MTRPTVAEVIRKEFYDRAVLAFAQGMASNPACVDLHAEELVRAAVYGADLLTQKVYPNEEV